MTEQTVARRIFKTMADVRAANKESGYYFFSPDTLRFFASRIASKLYIKQQCFITSEKKCFNDETRVYSVRYVRPDGSIDTLANGLACIESAREYIIAESEAPLE